MQEIKERYKAMSYAFNKFQDALDEYSDAIGFDEKTTPAGVVVITELMVNAKVIKSKADILAGHVGHLADVVDDIGRWYE